MNLPDQSAARVEISCLAGVAAEFIENSLVPSTRQSYSIGQEEYKEFCAHLNVPTASRRDCINPVHSSAITPPVQCGHISRESGIGRCHRVWGILWQQPCDYI